MPAARQLSRSSFPALRRQRDDRQMPPGRLLAPPDLLHDLEAVEPRHVDVQEQEVEGLFDRQFQCHPAVGHHPHEMTPPGQQPLHVPRVELAVLGHQDAQRRRAGGGTPPRRHVRRPGVEPIKGLRPPPEPRREGEGTAPPGSLSTSIVPPIRPTSRAAMARPNPVPPNLRVVELSTCSKARKIRPCPSGGMPMPVSLTANRRTTSRRSRGRRRRPPARPPRPAR